MNINSNASKTVAALITLNAGLFVSHHLPMIGLRGPALDMELVSDAGEDCKAKEAAAQLAKMQARATAEKVEHEAMEQARKTVHEARKTAHEAAKAQNEALRSGDVARASTMKVRTSITDYVHCAIKQGAHSIVGGL